MRFGVKELPKTSTVTNPFTVQGGRTVLHRGIVRKRISIDLAPNQSVAPVHRYLILNLLVKGSEKEDKFVLAVSLKSFSTKRQRRVLTACTQPKHMLVSVVATKLSLKSHQVVMRFALFVFGKTRCRIALGDTPLLIESD